MFGKVKKWLGIEGVKLELILPEEVEGKGQLLEGTIVFTSMHDQVVKKIKVVMIERYARGRRKDKRVDEYEMGEIELLEEIQVPKGESIEVAFELPFERVTSDMDDLEGKNIFFKGIVKAAKLIKGAKSTFVIEAEADVNGVALNPFDKQEVNLV